MPRYQTKFNDKWKIEHSWLDAWSADNNRAYCKLCNCDFSIGNGGINDVIAHKNGKNHLRREKDAIKSRHVTEYAHCKLFSQFSIVQTTIIINLKLS